MIGDRIIKVIKRQGNTWKNKMVSGGNSEDYGALNLIIFNKFLWVQLKLLKKIVYI